MILSGKLDMGKSQGKEAESEQNVVLASRSVIYPSTWAPSPKQYTATAAESVSSSAESAGQRAK
jgi:hypothetical protein